jgi:hypothetical protein
LAIAVSRGGNEAKTALLDEFLIQEHLKPIYPGLGELTIPYPQPDRSDFQGSGKLKLIHRTIKDLFFSRFLDDHDVSRGYALVAGYLNVDAELGMYIGKRWSTDLRANAAQVKEIFFPRQFLDLVAQDQNVDASENRTIRHGRAPPAIGRTGQKRSIPHAGLDQEHRLARGNLAIRLPRPGLLMP